MECDWVECDWWDGGNGRQMDGEDGVSKFEWKG